MVSRIVRILIALAVAATGAGFVAPPAAAAVATSISFTSGTTAQVGATSILSVAISSADGTTRPVGGVQFTNSQGQIVGTASTTAAGAAGATASIPWVPTQETTYTFNATFYPDGTALASSSTAAPITVRATPTGQVVSIAVTQMYLGIPTTLTGTVYPATLQGTLAFSANYAVDGISPSLPVVNGTASYTFTPGSLGWQQFIVSFTSTSRPVVQGAVSQWVNVLPPLGTDDIALNPTPVSLANGTSVTVNPTTTAGATPTLATVGGCSLAGTTITATSGTGTCTVTGTSPSAGGYLGTTESWPIPLVPGAQTATVSAPASGRLAVGRTVTLAKTSTQTNAGQRISWRVSPRSGVCSLSTSGGAVRLTMDAKGTCTARGSAPAVAGQWNAYSVKRTYTAR